jgi:FAD/FMN-containing dehydrogenase/Fe-S oxidoreductase
MDADQQRIEEDLRGLVAGDVRCDDLFTQLYACDASIYELRPLGVVRPRSVDDVVATVRYAAENHLPVHARGAGSGLAGESLGRGLILDFSRYFRRVVADDGDRVRVQPGVVLSSLNRYLSRSGRLFGPDPAMREITTMGSVVAIDASGSHWPRYGSARQHVVELEIVLTDGQILRVSQHPISGMEQAPPANGHNQSSLADSSGENGLRRLVHSVSGLIDRNAQLISEHRPQSLVNRSGYRFDDVVADGQLDLARLLTGSEGTLALITEATLTVDPMPLFRGCVLLLFDSLDKAARTVVELAALSPAACDLMDRRHLSLAREADLRYELLIPGEAEAILLVEQHAGSRNELIEKLDAVVELAQYKTGLAAASQVAQDDADFHLFWGLARRLMPTMYHLQGATRPEPCVEDIAIPPAALPVFLRHLQDSLKRLQVTASVFAHAGHGQLHIRPFLDLANQDDVRVMELLANELYEKVWLLHGTVSGEHGDGLSRTPFLARQYGPLVNVFRELKHIFDPQGLLNPGKIVPLVPMRMTQNLRAARLTANGEAMLPVIPQVGELQLAAGLPANGGQPADQSPPPSSAPYEPQLPWRPDELMGAARLCNGCGVCRATIDVRMCPIFHLSPREEASPRAKANLVRAVMTGRLPSDTFVADACKEVADLCVHCHMCRLECPANVDIPKLMLEAKAAYVRTNGLSMPDRLLMNVDALARLAGRLPGVANWALRQPQMRWLMEKFMGIAQGRKLPRLARRDFIRLAAMRRLNRAPRTVDEKVVYFVDTYANHFDTQLAEALVAVLKHNGVSVYVPSRQSHAAMTMISQGALDAARRVAARNIAQLAEHVRRGFTIIATEPSAVLALRHEYPLILDDDEDAVHVAAHTQEACHYLWRLHHRGRLKLDFRTLRLSVGYHVPCHLRALDVGAPAENLLRLVPGLRVTRVEKGCSGMAGLWGVKRDNYRASLRAGLELINTIRSGPFQVGMTECSTCKLQMEQGTTKPTVHPIKLLALAYGLWPDLDSLTGADAKGTVIL